MFNKHPMMTALFAKHLELALTRPVAGRHIVLKSKQPSQDLNQDIRFRTKHLFHTPNWYLFFRLEFAL